jgi:hypothetical protein
VEVVGRVGGAIDPAGQVLAVRLNEGLELAEDELFAIYAVGRTIGVGCVAPTPAATGDRLLLVLPECRNSAAPAGAVLVRE